MYNIIPYLSFTFTIVIVFKRSDNVVFWPYILLNVPSVDVSIGIPLSNIEVHIFLFQRHKRMCCLCLLMVHSLLQSRLFIYLYK
jgi:hypothetical protein